MKAKIGDWLVTKGAKIDKAERRGHITEVHSDDGSPPYVVRWLDNDHVATVFPGPDSLVVTAGEQAETDEKARQRFGTVQSVIAGESGERS